MRLVTNIDHGSAAEDSTNEDVLGIVEGAKLILYSIVIRYVTNNNLICLMTFYYSDIFKQLTIRGDASDDGNLSTIFLSG